MDKINQHHNGREQVSLDDCDKESLASSQFLLMQNNQLIDFQEHLERECNVIPVLVSTEQRNLNLFKSYLLRNRGNKPD